MNGMALCSGVGGIDLGLKLAIPGYRTVCHVEREAFCAAVLVARMEDEALERAPIWDDVTTFDGKPWHGVVDIITAGFPCQPHSVAGKRAGTADSRWIWDDIARIIGEVDPGLVFIENVPGLVTSGLERVWGDLRGMGFQVEAGFFSAAEVGAPHRRQRLFVLAHAERFAGRPDIPKRGSSGREIDGRDHPELADAERGGLGQPVGGEGTSGEGAQNRSGDVGNTERTRWSASRTGSEIDGGLESFPPGPQGRFPDGLEPAIRRVVDGDASRMDRLRAIGNGVVPAVVANAWQTLAKQAGLA